MRKAAHLRAGFTLIELLVVIGIIAVLISVLLPSLAAARRQANLIKCAANLRQLHQGSSLFAHEHGGYLPLAGNLNCDIPNDNTVESTAKALGDARRKRYIYAYEPGRQIHVIVPFPAAIAQYMGWRNLSFNDWNKLDQELNNQRGVWQMFMCPETDALERGRASTNPDDNSPVSQGAMMVLSQLGNITHYWSTNSDFALNEALLGFDYRVQYKPRRLSGKLAHIQRPSETMLFCDAKLGKVDPKFPMNFQCPWITMAPTLESTGPVALSDVLVQNTQVMPLRAQIDQLRHKKRINVCFVDGHVETLPISAKSLERVFLLPK
jgi:prepilin-type N-terminal cleavage/methylation domain-containing protein/prepilin-type processing-associated H-X9-DG protein